MGGGASALLESVRNDPDLDGYRSEFATLLTQQYANYKNNENLMTTEELKTIIFNALKKEDLRILMKEIHNLNQNSVGNSGGDNSNRYRNKIARKFVCCIDGTDNGDITFNTMSHLIRKRDCIAMLYSPLDDGSKVAFEDPTGMKYQYESLLSQRGIPSANVIFQIEPKGNMNTLSIIKRYVSIFNQRSKQVDSSSSSPLDSDYVYDIPPDFILLGYDSWKGQNGLNPNTTSNSSDLVMRTLHIPCIICKKKFSTKMILNGVRKLSNANSVGAGNSHSLTYLMAIDDTETSLNGLEILLQLLKATDRLRLVHIHYPIDTIPPHLLQLHLNNTATITLTPPANSSPSIPSSPSSEEKGEKHGGVRQGGISQLLPSSPTSTNDSSPNIPLRPSRPSVGSASAAGITGSSQTKYYPLSVAVKEQYLDILREYGPRQAQDIKEDVIIELSSTTNDIQSVRDCLIDYVNGSSNYNAPSPDFFVIAPRTQRRLTSFTEYILKEVDTSIILCKN